MKKVIIICLIGCYTVVGVAFSAIEIDRDRIQGTPLSFKIPPGWPQPVYDFKKNPITKQGFELGRKLFYDGRLSKDGYFSCASCHQQFAAFSTYDHNVSHGFNNSFTTRNAPGLFNLAWQKEFMLDGGVNHLDLQPLAPITAHNEMAETLDNVLRKLRSDAVYRRLFKASFGNELINTQRMTKALSQFMLMMVSADSKYDKVKRGESVFHPLEQEGYLLFQQKCVSCHQEPLFTDYTYRNIGLPIDPYLNDLGRMTITRDPKDSLKFRVPTLRNITSTAPYAHDGRFYAIPNILDHYRGKVVHGPNTDSLLLNNIVLSKMDAEKLKFFLYTLTDTAFLKDKRFSDPAPRDRLYFVH